MKLFIPILMGCSRLGTIKYLIRFDNEIDGILLTLVQINHFNRRFHHFMTRIMPHDCYNILYNRFISLNHDVLRLIKAT